MCETQKQLSECQIKIILVFTKRYEYTFLKLSHRHPVSLIQEYFPALIQITLIADIESVQIFQILALLTQFR